jgi:GTPase SAR1 family protein
MKTLDTVALVGKVGHGKTFLLNKLTGSRFLSSASASSCTRTLQYGYSTQKQVLVVDTPGFYASDNLAEHLAAQKVALEGLPLSCVYFVVKYGRADEVALEASRIIEFVGDDDICIIITHSDTVSDDPGYNPSTLTARVSDLVGLPSSNIFIVGKKTDAESIERFVHSTLHAPKEYKVSAEQAASITALCVCARSFDKKVRTVHAKIAAASLECCDKVATYGRSYEMDVAITGIQKTTTDMVSMAKQEIFVDSAELPEDQQHVVYGKAGLALAVRLKAFVDASNKLLSWDVTDPADARNSYKSCPHCGAIFIKTEGCDGNTTCGSMPVELVAKKERPGLDASFEAAAEKNGWKVQYHWNGQAYGFPAILMKMRRLGSVRHPAATKKGSPSSSKPAGSSIESGCGRPISWASMAPIDPEKLKVLGDVELQTPGSAETKTEQDFAKTLERHVAENRKMLLEACRGK